MNLTPEQYKQLAEFAGYTIHYDRELELNFAVNENNRIGWPGDYTPVTNDAQAFELLRKLLEKSWKQYNIGFYGGNAYLCMSSGGTLHKGKTLNLAICHAVLALENQE